MIEAEDNSVVRIEDIYLNDKAEFQALKTSVPKSKHKTKYHNSKKSKKLHTPDVIQILDYEDATAEILIVDDDSSNINNVL